MQIVNDTDERIVLEPGEGVSGDTVVHQSEGDTYRVALTGRVKGPSDKSEFRTARDFLDGVEADE